MREFACIKIGIFYRSRNAFLLGLCLCASIGCLTACGKKEVDYYNESSVTNEDNNSSTELQGTVPEHVSQEEDGVNGTSVKVDADVINGEAYGKMPVATLEIKDWSEKDVQQYAEAVFDEGSIEVVLPYSRCSQEFLIQEQAEIENRIKELGFTNETIYQSVDYCYLGYQLSSIQGCLQDYDESNVVENDGSYKWITTVLEEDEEEYDISTCQMKGTIEGEAYALTFRKGSDFCCMRIYKIKGSNYAEENIIYSYGVDAEKLSFKAEEIFPNTCMLTEQEAEAQVEGLINQLGISNVAVSAVYPARQDVWEYDEGSGMLSSTTQVTKGYLVYLGTAVNNYTTPCIEAYLNVDCNESEKFFDGHIYVENWVAATYGYEGIVALVTDEGIEQFQYLNPMTVSEITAEQAVLTSFESIHQCVMEYMKSIGVNYNIDTIRLCMGRVKYEDSYALIPVWCYEYGASVSDVTVFRSAIMVNAIDANIIDVDSGRPVQQ